MLLCRRGAGMTAATEAALYVALRPHCIDSGTVVSGAGLVDAIMSFGADLDRDEATAIKVRWCTGGAPPPPSRPVPDATHSRVRCHPGP